VTELIKVQKTLMTEKGLLHLNVDAGKIMALLNVKHSKDVIIPECKNGETWGARDLLKMDAWVLRRSYSPLTTIGYEIKCSRKDFEQDQKWTGYLDLCHEFCFVCPAGLIRATDLPQRVGLIWASKDRLHTKRKAQRVEPDTEKLNRLLIYVVMARSQIVASMYELDRHEPKDHLQSLKEAIEKANERKELAYFINGHVRQIYNQTREVNLNLKWREDTVKRFEKQLAELGIVWDSKANHWQETMRIENEIRLLKNQISFRTLESMKRLANTLTGVVDEIEQYRNKKTGGKNALLP